MELIFISSLTEDYNVHIKLIASFSDHVGIYSFLNIVFEDKWIDWLGQHATHGSTPRTPFSLLRNVQLQAGTRKYRCLWFGTRVVPTLAQPSAISDGLWRSSNQTNVTGIQSSRYRFLALRFVFAPLVWVEAYQRLDAGDSEFVAVITFVNATRVEFVLIIARHIAVCQCQKAVEAKNFWNMKRDLHRTLIYSLSISLSLARSLVHS